MDVKTFFLQNDIMNKLRAALENISIGQGYSAFDGLQNGECTVKIAYDGVNITLTNFAQPVPIVVKKEDAPVQPIEPAATETASPTEEKTSQIRRRNK